MVVFLSERSIRCPRYEATYGQLRSARLIESVSRDFRLGRAMHPKARGKI